MNEAKSQYKRERSIHRAAELIRRQRDQIRDLKNECSQTYDWWRRIRERLEFWTSYAAGVTFIALIAIVAAAVSILNK